MAEPFQPGDRVRVQAVYLPGHIRTPFYVRGQIGVVDRVLGPFRNPEELAFGRSGEPKQYLYRVRFQQTDLWPDYQGPAHDTLDVDLYHPWLNPA